MITTIRPIYRHKNSTELNKQLENLLHNLEIEKEGIIGYLMDLTLNQKERREKTVSEGLTDLPEMVEAFCLQDKEKTLSSIIEALEGILYSGQEETPITVHSQLKPPRTYKKATDIPKWLALNVRPIILEGETRQDRIAEMTGVPSSTLSYWVQKAYDEQWREYIKDVQKGIF